MSDAILALNAGSSSIKFGLFKLEGGPALVLKGLLEDQGHQPRLTVTESSGAVLEDHRWSEGASHEAMLGHMLDWIEHHLGADRLVGVGHRVVHGGERFVEPVRLDEATIEAIRALTPLAPLHQPRCLEPVHALKALRPELLQTASFDTAFHHTLAPVVRRYAIPRRYEAEGIRKYGFHGLSYAWIAGRLATADPTLPSRRTVVAHLGNGASLCAMRHGRSLDTTMGFSALDGLVMGTRPGALDPGIVIHLQRAHGLSADAVEHLLYHESGLRGVSELTSDMRELEASDDARAQDAIDLFTFRIAREAAALAQTMAGIDALVFTGGIGEHSPAIRAAVCRRLSWLGVDLAPEANVAGETRISQAGSRIAAYRIPTDEEAVIARDTAALHAAPPTSN